MGVIVRAPVCACACLCVCQPLYPPYFYVLFPLRSGVLVSYRLDGLSALDAVTLSVRAAGDVGSSDGSASGALLEVKPLLLYPLPFLSQHVYRCCLRRLCLAAHHFLHSPLLVSLALSIAP